MIDWISNLPNFSAYGTPLVYFFYFTSCYFCRWESAFTLGRGLAGMKH